MELARLMFPFGLFQILIHKVDCPEETVFRHLVRRKNLNHPVHHFSSQPCRNIVLAEEHPRSVQGLEYSVEDILRVVLGDLLGYLLFEFRAEGCEGKGLLNDHRAPVGVCVVLSGCSP